MHIMQTLFKETDHEAPSTVRGFREEIQLFSYLHLASAIVHLECSFGIKKPRALNLDRGENCNGK